MGGSPIVSWRGVEVPSRLGNMEVPMAPFPRAGGVYVGKVSVL